MFKALILAATLAASPYTPANDAPDCVTLGHIKAELAAKQVPGTEYTGVVAQNMIEGLIKVLGAPPDPNYLQTDLLIVAIMGEQAFIGFVVNNCYIGRAILPVSIWKEIVAHGRGI